MKSKQADIIIGTILLLPTLFVSGFAIHDALMPVMSCKQACDTLQEDFIGCDHDLCLCRPRGSSLAEHIETYDDGKTKYSIECTQ